MSDLESLERRVNEIEHKLDRLTQDAGGEPELFHHTRGRTPRIYIGVLILLLGLLWLGKDFDIEWLQRMEFWPIAVMVIGLLIIIGERRR
jgi:hypothetical protein